MVKTEKTSFKRKRHRPTFNGKNVKEFVSIFKNYYSMGLELTELSDWILGVRDIEWKMSPKLITCYLSIIRMP